MSCSVSSSSGGMTMTKARPQRAQMRRLANSIIAASAALVEEVVAVEEAGRALASAAPVRS